MEIIKTDRKTQIVGHFNGFTRKIVSMGKRDAGFAKAIMQDLEPNEKLERVEVKDL